MPEDAPEDVRGRRRREGRGLHLRDVSIPRTHRHATISSLPRIELSRLTVRQYRNSVADLIGSFRNRGRWDEKRGLKGDYQRQRQRPT